MIPNAARRNCIVFSSSVDGAYFKGGKWAVHHMYDSESFAKKTKNKK